MESRLGRVMTGFSQGWMESRLYGDKAVWR